MNHCHVGDWEAASRMPVPLRRWWIGRWQQEQKAIQDAGKGTPTGYRPPGMVER